MSEESNARARMQEIRDDREEYRRLQAENGDAALAPPAGLVEAAQTVVDRIAEYGLQGSGLAAQAAEATALPIDAAARKDIPLVTGLLDYFPAALAEIAKVSKAGNDKHNPGEPLHWARGKSMDQADCIGRHLLERGGFDPETGQRHSAQMAWRALALLQLEMEEAGAPMARGAA